MDTWYLEQAPEPDAHYRELAQQRQDSLTKPQGALGRLEEVAIQLAALQRSEKPSLERIAVAVFAGDHGVVSEGISAFPQSVTAEMVRNFSRGGAAISVLARQLDAPLYVVNVGTVEPLEELPGVLDRRIAGGTRNICTEAAMNEQQFQKALSVGREVIDEAGELDMFIGGEMGIGNSTIAAAIAGAHTRLGASTLVGRGTGLNDQGLAKKAAVVTRALSRHLPHMRNGEEVLRRIGGFEVNALAGAYIRAAQRGIAVLVDGYICTAAALGAVKINPSVRPWLFFSHCSSEPGHSRLLNKLDAEALLELDMRLGEGSGAATAFPILRSACALHNEMASFEEAGVSRDLPETPRREY